MIFSVIFFIAAVAFIFTVSIVVIFFICIYAAVSVAVGYCHCRHISVKNVCTVITSNIIVYISGTTFNVTKYVIILISVIIGVCDVVGGGGG